MNSLPLLALIVSGAYLLLCFILFVYLREHKTGMVAYQKLEADHFDILTSSGILACIIFAISLFFVSQENLGRFTSKENLTTNITLCILVLSVVLSIYDNITDSAYLVDVFRGMWYLIVGLIGLFISGAIIYILIYLGGSLIQALSGKWNYVFFALGIIAAIGLLITFWDDVSELFIEVIFPVMSIILALATLMWLLSVVSSFNFSLNIHTIKYGLLFAMITLVVYLVFKSEHKDLISVISGIILLVIGLYAGYHLFFKTNLQQQPLTSKKVDPKVEVAEQEKIVASERQGKEDFKKSFEALPDTSLFKRKTIIYKNRDGQTETVELTPEFSFGRLKNSKGMFVDTVSAIYSYSIKNKIVSESTPTSWEGEFIDYRSGGYLLSDSRAAVELMGIVKQQIDGFLKPYLDVSGGMRIRLVGWADSIHIGDKLIYKGEFDQLISGKELYYEFNGMQKATRITPNSRIISNEVLAYLRTIGARKYLEEITGVGVYTKPKVYNHVAIAHSEKSGGDFRKIQIQLDIHEPNLSPAPTNPPISDGKKSCWVCNLMNIWVEFSLLGIFRWLFELHHKKLQSSTIKNKDSHEWWRNGSIIAFILITILLAFCN